MSDVQSYIAINGQTFNAADIEHPDTKEFRGAWDFDGDAIVINMVKAREIQRDAIRAERAPKLEELDIAFMKATERGNPTTEIVAKKEALRNATEHPSIDAAETPEELAAINLASIIDADA